MYDTFGSVPVGWFRTARIPSAYALPTAASPPSVLQCINMNEEEEEGVFN